MIKIRANDKFVSVISNKMIRVKSVKRNTWDSRYSLVEVVDIDNRGKTIKGSNRYIYQDSIRRRYHY